MANNRVTYQGTTGNAKAGAALITENNEVIYIYGKAEWEPELKGKTLIIEGELVNQPAYPQATIDETGAVSQGMSGEATLLKMVSYSIVG